MKKILLIAILSIATLFSKAQFNENFENPISGWAMNNMNVNANDALCANKSAHSAGAFKSGSTFSINTPVSTVSGHIAINFAYQVANNSSSGWIMVVELYQWGNPTAVFSTTYNSAGGIISPGCTPNFTSITTNSLPQGSYSLYIGFTTASTNNDAARNFVVVDNVSFSGDQSLPVTFVGQPIVQRVDDTYVKVTFRVEDQSSLKQYNVQFSEDNGKNWNTVAIVYPDNAVTGKTYSVQIKSPKIKH